MSEQLDSNADPLLASLADLGNDPLPGELDDAALLAGALAGFRSGIPSVPEPPSKPAARRAGVVTALLFGVGALAAAAVLLVALRPSAELGLADQPARPMAQAALQKLDVAGEAVAREAALRKKRNTPPVSPPAPAAPAVDVDPEPAPDSATTDAIADPTGAAPPRRAPAKPRADAETLLQRAQQQLAAGERTAALASYRQLLRAHPSSAEGRAARVSVGRMELARGKAKRALAHFDDYLSGSGGALREEARYGRIRALRALGRTAQERGSIDSFLSDHPRSVYAPRLGRRLGELEAK